MLEAYYDTCSDTMTVDSNLTIILTDWFQSFNPGGDYLNPAMQSQMLSNYLCIFTAQGSQFVFRHFAHS